MINIYIYVHADIVMQPVYVYIYTYSIYVCIIYNLWYIKDIIWIWKFALKGFQE